MTDYTKTCSLAGCAERVKARGWCGNHYSQWRRTGHPLPSRTWAPRVACRVCGKPSTRGFREFCSEACRMYFRRHEGAPPEFVLCVSCGAAMSLAERGRGGYRRRIDTARCAECKKDGGRQRDLLVMLLAERDGTLCGICHTVVDLALSWPNQMSPSVDHVVPKALGGVNSPSNVQLAHMICNARKHRSLAEDK